MLTSRLRNFKQKNTNLWNFSCPYCGDSQKNKTKARGYVFPKGNDLIYKCHNCGVGTNVGNLVKHVDSSLHREYTLEKYKSGETNNAYVANTILNISPPKFDRVEKAKIFEHAEWLSRLPSEHYCLNYVTKRQIPSTFYDKLLFTQHYADFVTALVPNHGKQLLNDARLVIPFYDEDKNLVAFQGRSLGESKLRYITIKMNDDNHKFFGLDRINKEETIYVVEGPIDSMFLENAIATADANLMAASKLFDKTKIVLVYDNEPRNKELHKQMEKAIDEHYAVVIWPELIVEKDVNEMVLNGGFSPDEIQDFISKCTFVNLRAKMEFINWKKR